MKDQLKATNKAKKSKKTPPKVVAISDCHGMAKTLFALIDRAHQEWGDFDLYLLGDLVDRGPRSKEVVQYAINNRVPTVMGNHESLLIDFYRDGHHEYDEGCWLWNGGGETLKSFNGDIPTVAKAWMEQLPLYFIPDGHPNLLLSHTGHGKITSPFGTVIDALWCREPAFPKDGMFRVFGHSQQHSAVITDTFANIDTGAAYKDRGYGKMTAFLWPDKKVISIDSID